MKLGKKDDLKAMSFTDYLKIQLDVDEIWLIIQNPSTVAVGGSFCTFEILALCLQFWSLCKAPFLQNHSHAFKNSLPGMAFRKVKGLR